MFMQLPEPAFQGAVPWPFHIISVQGLTFNLVAGGRKERNSYITADRR